MRSMLLKTSSASCCEVELKLRQEKFQGDRTTEAAIISAVDHAHSACAQNFDQTKMADRSPDQTERIVPVSRCT